MRRFIHITLLIITIFSLTPLVAMSQNKQFVVVLDAGHGGKDPGAVGSSPRNREKDINLGITLGIGQLLKANCPDVKVVYTRSTDVFVELGRRAEIANKIKADLFVSIHTNALPKEAKKATGVQSYTLCLRTASTNLEVEKRENSVIQYEQNGESKYSYSNPNSSESDIMFELMQDRDMKESVKFAKMAQNEMVNTAGRSNAGVNQANLAVLRLTYMPSVLLEVGYISTPSEEQFLLSNSGQNAMAKSIYNAIVKYKGQTTGRQSKLENVSSSPATNDQPVEITAKETPAKASNATRQATSTNTTKQTASTKKKTVYKVQILVGTVKLADNDRQFKGLKCERHQYGKKYTYTYGNASTMEEAKKIRKSILDKFPECYIVTFQE